MELMSGSFWDKLYEGHTTRRSEYPLIAFWCDARSVLETAEYRFVYVPSGMYVCRSLVDEYVYCVSPHDLSLTVLHHVFYDVVSVGCFVNVSSEKDC